MRWRMGLGLGFLCAALAGPLRAEEGGTRGIVAVPENNDPVAPGVLPSYGRYHALLIGIDKYRGEWQSLKGPGQDVRQLGQILENRFGFAVEALVDKEVSKQSILESLGKLREKLRRGDGDGDLGDNLLIWYAGHGEKGEDEAWNWQWVMPDGETTLSYRELRSRLREIDARHILLVSDSCFAGGMQPVAGYVKQQPAARIAAARARSFQIVTSGDVSAVADVYKDGSSPFALQFLRELERLGPDHPPLAAWELFSHVREVVDQWSNRQPVMGFDDAEEGFGPRGEQGQFFFVHPEYLRREASKARDLGEHRISRAMLERLAPVGRRTVDGTSGFARYRLRDSADDAPMVAVGSADVQLPGASRTTYVEAFLMDAHEVTVGQFRRFLDATQNRTTIRYRAQQGYGEDDQPVVGVTLQQARAYAAWAKKSLPTEAEWYAAAALKWVAADGGTKRVLNEFERPWHFLEPRPAVTFEWSAFPPRFAEDEPDVSCWGVERMASGVREWCVPVDGDPAFGVVRGGTVVRASSRDRLGEELPAELRRVGADTPRNNVGFRCVVRDINR